MTNLQRGNTQTIAPIEPLFRSVHQLAAQGELFLCHLDEKLANQIDENGLTPILWASSYGQINSIETLLKQGADLKFKGPNGENALMLAASNGHLHMMKILIANGLEINDTDEV